MSSMNEKACLGRVAKMVLLSLVMVGTLLTGSGPADAATPWYALGGSHTLVLTQDGMVWSVGSNRYGQLGNGATNYYFTAELQRVKGLSDVVALVAADSHSVALKRDGTVWAWGNNGAGQLGPTKAEFSSVPLQIAGLGDVKAIATGNSHVLALKGDGTVWAWGNNQIGQLGDGSKASSRVPVQVTALKDVVAIAAGNFHSIALKKDGTVWGWGYNSYGALGEANAGGKGEPVPVLVQGLADVKGIASGQNHSVAVKRDGTVWVWGSNRLSQFGNGSRTDGGPRPVMVGEVGHALDVIAHGNHSEALKDDGTVWAWGAAEAGEWGNGMHVNGSDRPVQMRGVSGPTKISAVVNLKSLAGGAVASTGAGTSLATMK